MAAYKTKLLQSLTFVGVFLGYTSRHDVVLLVAFHDSLPDIVYFTICWLGHYFPRRSTGYVSEGFVALASNNSVVGVVDLGPGLLHDEDPELIAIGTRKHEAVVESWEEVINHDTLMLSIFGQLDRVDALLVKLPRDKESPDSVRSLGNASQHTQEIAVAEASLLDVVGLDLVGEHLQSAISVVELLEIWGPLPNNLCPLVFVLEHVRILGFPVLNQTGIVSREVFICVLLVATLQLLQLLLVLGLDARRCTQVAH